MRRLILFSMLSLALLSCKKDIDELNRIKDGDFTVVDWEPTFVVPILDTRTTLGKMFTELDTLITKLEEDSLFLTINEQDLFVATYRFPFTSGTLESYYTIEDQTDQFEVVIPQETLDAISVLPVGAPLLPTLFDTVLVLDINSQYNALLELIELSNGEITIGYNHNFNQNVGMDIKVRSITERGTNDTVSFRFEGLASSPSETQQELLSNHIIDLERDGEFNKLEIYIALRGNIINPTLSGDRFTIDFAIGSYKIDYVQGFLGDFETQIPSDKFRFDIFDQLDVPGISVRSPSIELDIKSTLGIPMDIRIDELAVGYRDNTTATLGLDGEVVAVDGVTNRSDIPDNPSSSKYLVDNSSQLDELLSTKPNKLFYSLNASAEPTDQDLVKFFLADSSHIAIDLTATVPFDFSIKGYERIDTIQLSVGDSLGSLGDDEDSLIAYVEKAQLKLIIENQLPFDVEMQGFLIDDEGNILGQVFDGGFKTVLANDNVDNNGVAQRAQDVITFVELDQEKFDQLVEATHIVLQSRSETTTTGNVKLLSSYRFGVRAGVLAKFKVPIEIEKQN